MVYCDLLYLLCFAVMCFLPCESTSTLGIINIITSVVWFMILLHVMWLRIVTNYLSGYFLFETRVLSAPRNKGRQFHEAQFIANVQWQCLSEGAAVVALPAGL